MSAIFFYGCGSRAGHYLIDKANRFVRTNPTPWPDRDLDPETNPIYGRPPALDAWMGDEAQTEGAAVLSYRRGWTRLGWPDRSVDTRRGSHADLIAEGVWTADEMLARGRVAFPWLFARIKYEIVVRRTLHAEVKP